MKPDLYGYIISAPVLPVLMAQKDEPGSMRSCKGASLLMLRLSLFLHPVLKGNLAPTSFSASVSKLIRVLSNAYFTSGRDGINIAVTIGTDLVHS